MELIVEGNAQRIDKYLVEQLEESRSTIAKMIEQEYILVNGLPTKANYVVKINDKIEIIKSFKDEIEIISEDIPLDIVYEDNDIIIINKESGMVVHPGNGNHGGTLVNALMHHTASLSDINGEIRPGIVHRIDKDTSGLMIVAKNNKAHQILAQDLAEHKINREYIALIKGEFLSDTATIDAPIGRDRINRKRMCVTNLNSKNAITHIRVIERYKNFTLIKASLETGRTHQIRVHMDYIGHPIFNDPVYTKDNTTEFGQFLHSASIDFVHPHTKEKMHFEANIPEYMQNYIDKLEKK